MSEQVQPLPTDFTYEEYTELLPRRCFDCKIARQLLVLTVEFETDDGNTMLLLNNIHQTCPGYSGVSETRGVERSDDNKLTIVYHSYDDQYCRLPD